MLADWYALISIWNSWLYKYPQGIFNSVGSSQIAQLWPNVPLFEEFHILWASQTRRFTIVRILDDINLEIYNCQKWVFYYFVKSKSPLLGELVVKCDIRKKKLVYRKVRGEGEEKEPRWQIVMVSARWQIYH